MKILLVEDDKGITQFVKKGLGENAFSVDVAFDGEDGLFLALHRSYDLIILDILLPNMDGIEILKRIRKIRSFKSRKHELESPKENKRRSSSVFTGSTNPGQKRVVAWALD